jgi:hypothetical protein
LLGDRRIRIHTSDYWIRIQEAQKHVDPEDPDSDPQHFTKKQANITSYPGRVARQFLKRSCCTPAAKRWRKLTPKSISIIRNLYGLMSDRG